MGCGNVCGASAPSSNKQPVHSQTKLQQLLPKIKISPPLLPEKLYTKFSQSLRETPSSYVLKCGSAVTPTEQLDSAILQKWKIVLYGLNKGDEVYNKCLGLQVRDEKQFVSHEQILTTNHSTLANKSYHEVKPATQYHECFVQIEKDLNRTFDFREQKKKVFENVLKRVSNYFPSMGYTQGVNFVIGYLLVQGYSESDAFWMFAHLAINQRYLILGLYEDGFPLSYIYTLIFKNMLRRFDPQLYTHLYLTLGLDESMWIFKWFITCYIYSFPLNTIRHVWDVVVQIGSIGLVYFALSLVMQLRQNLLKNNDPCDVSQFWQSIKDLNNFNKIVRMDKVIQKVYELKMTKGDLDGINELPQSFYKQYYKLNMLEPHRNPEGREIRYNERAVSQRKENHQKKLQSWYLKLLQERTQFRQRQHKSQNNFFPQLLKNEQSNMRKSIQLLQDKMVQNESMRRSKNKLPNIMTVDDSQKKEPSKGSMDGNYFDCLVHDNRYKIVLNKTSPTIQKESQKRIRLAARIEYDIEQEINELQGQSDSNNEIEASDHLTSRNQMPSINIESIDSVRIEQAPIPYNLQINSIHKFDHKKKASKDVVPKVNNLKMHKEDKRTGLSLAGQNVLCNLSITNSQYSESSAKNTTFKTRKQKQNNIARYNKNAKVRTEQNSQPSSEHEELSIDHNTDKDSLSNFTHRDDPRPERPSFSKDRMITQKDLLANSQILGQIKDPQRISKDITSEIQLFNGDGLFKKKRTCTKISGGTASNTGGVLRIDSLNKYLNIKNQNTGGNYQQQESVESILQASKHSQFHDRRVGSMIEEIESIK